MMSKGCSLQHLFQCKRAINQYLQSKNISDFTKYDASMKEGKVHYERWDYDIEKPVDITGIPKPKNYEDLYIRKLILHIPDENKYYYYDVDGEPYTGLKDKHNRSMQSILEMHSKKSDGWSRLTTNSIYINTGFLIVDNKTSEVKVTGEVHVIILYKIDEKENNSNIKPTSGIITTHQNEEHIEQSSALQSLSTQKYYIIPKKYLNN